MQARRDLGCCSFELGGPTGGPCQGREGRCRLNQGDGIANRRPAARIKPVNALRFFHCNLRFTLGWVCRALTLRHGSTPFSAIVPGNTPDAAGWRPQQGRTPLQGGGGNIIPKLSPPMRNTEPTRNTGQLQMLPVWALEAAYSPVSKRNAGFRRNDRRLGERWRSFARAQRCWGLRARALLGGPPCQVLSRRDCGRLPKIS